MAFDHEQELETNIDSEDEAESSVDHELKGELDESIRGEAAQSHTITIGSAG